MEAVVGSSIKIHNPTSSIMQQLEAMLTFDNPEYFRKERLGKWTGNVPKQLSLIERFGDWINIPFGMLPFVFDNRAAFERIANCCHVGENSFDFGSRIKPYDYQEAAIDAALKARQGVIVAPCGSGKTMIGLEIAARLGKRCLWLTHTSDLLNQSMIRAKEFLGLANEDYGTITEGRVNVGRVLTFATVQTMSKVQLDKLSDEFDVVIVDECHHVVGTPTRVMMFYKVIGALRARYKFGLTATPKRFDGLTGCMFALIGPKVHEIDKACIEERLCPVSVEMKPTGYSPDFNLILNPDGTLNRVIMINELVNDADRNKIIVDDVEAESRNGACLVLTDRVVHVSLLANELAKRGVNVHKLGVCTTKQQKETRNKVLNELNNGKVSVVVATFALAREGLDVPNLRALFLATPQKNETIITQATGRVARRAQGKEVGIVYDYEDGSSLLRSWTNRRKALYKRLGYAQAKI